MNNSGWIGGKGVVETRRICVLRVSFWEGNGGGERESGLIALSLKRTTIVEIDELLILYMYNKIGFAIAVHIAHLARHG